MRRSVVLGVAAVVAAAAAATALAAADGAAPPAGGAAARSTASSPTADMAAAPVFSDCWVPGPAGNISLTTAQAEQLTTRAVRALRRQQSPAELAPVVAGVLAGPVADGLVVARTLLAAPGAPRLTCSVTRTEVAPEKMLRTGLTPRAQHLRRAWTEVFGALPAGGFASGGVSTGHVDNSAHYEGRAVDVFFRPLDSTAQRRLGWVFAQWAVAHAERYHVLSVIYADHIWTSWASFAGFRDYQHPGGPTRNPVLRHLDHVHVAVESGRRYRPG
jgi:hypothetical protein